MGPTGSGKSTFIEAFEGNRKSLGISKDQLSGFTQQVTAYKLENAQVLSRLHDVYIPLYLIDTPGFCDSKISEMEIITQLKNWMSDQNITWIDNVLYLCPITDTRVPASKRRTIKMIQALLRDGCSNRVAVVTTMWDNLSTSQAKERAGAHFVELRDGIWQDMMDEGSQIYQFHNTRDSATRIIKAVLEARSIQGSHPIQDLDLSLGPEFLPGTLLYEELVDRINNAHKEKQHLRQEQIQLITAPETKLEKDVTRRLQEVRQDLVRLLEQLLGFGDPPPGFEGVPRRVLSQYLIDHVQEAQQETESYTKAISQLRNHGWVLRLRLKTALRKAESRLGELSKYLDESGDPQIPLGEMGLDEVLELLGPKVTLMMRLRNELDM